MGNHQCLTTNSRHSTQHRHSPTVPLPRWCLLNQASTHLTNHPYQDMCPHHQGTITHHKDIHPFQDLVMEDTHQDMGPHPLPMALLHHTPMPMALNILLEDIPTHNLVEASVTTPWWVSHGSHNTAVSTTCEVYITLICDSIDIEQKRYYD